MIAAGHPRLELSRAPGHILEPRAVLHAEPRDSAADAADRLVDHGPMSLPELRGRRRVGRDQGFWNREPTPFDGGTLVRLRAVRRHRRRPVDHQRGRLLRPGPDCRFNLLNPDPRLRPSIANWRQLARIVDARV